MNIVFMESLGMDEKAVRNACRTLEGMGHRVRFYAERSEDEAELIKRAENAEVIVISNVPLHKSFFDACPALKMISVAFTGRRILRYVMRRGILPVRWLNCR